VSDHSINVERAEWHVAVVTFERPSANFFSPEMIGELADTLEAIGDDGTTRAMVLRVGEGVSAAREHRWSEFSGR
jgi:enoyl-CoA hydratase/carnithine racemase